MLLKSIDIHNHLLPGVDDGFKTAEESLEAIRGLTAAGVRELVFTPHINPDVYPQNDEDRMRRAYEQFLPLLPAGVYGWASVKIIRYLARRGYCDFVATDLHSLHQLERILSGKATLLLKRPLGNLFRV